MVIVNILVFLLTLSFVIIIHELGHFVMARRAGILCHEFSLGMGPVLWQTKKGETMYSIRAIPLGGYVMMAGEEIEQDAVKVGRKVRIGFDGDTIDTIVLDVHNETYESLEEVTVEAVDLKGEGGAPLTLNQYEVRRDAMIVVAGRTLQVAPADRNFNGKTVGQRFGAIFAGPFMNFLLAIVVFFVVHLIVGFPNTDDSTIGVVSEDLPAYGELRPGDRITAINGTPVSSWDELQEAMDEHQNDRTIEFTVDRNGNEVLVTLTPLFSFFNVGLRSAQGDIDTLAVGPVAADTFADKIGFQAGDRLRRINGTVVTTWDEVADALLDMAQDPFDETNVYTFEIERGDETLVLTNEESGTSRYEQPYNEAFLETQNVPVVSIRVGISPEYTFDLGRSLTGSVSSFGASASIIFTTLALLFDNEGAGAIVGVDDLAGPLGIYQITSAALSEGFVSLLQWVGLLSVNLGIVNLLPIPALDGGRLVFLGYEAITRRKPNQKVENTLHYVMYILLLGLFVFITFNDLMRLFNLK
jgi:regulator of sigma E protease